MSALHRVVITGLGAMAANGMGLDRFWRTTLSGESGVRLITLFDTEGLDCKIAGEISEFRPEDYIDPILKPKRMGRFTQLGIVAAREAIENSGVTAQELKQQETVPVVIGVSTNAMELAAQKPGITTAVSGIPHAATSAIAYLHDVQTDLMTVSNGCASSLDAVAYAARLIRKGYADIAIAGGAESSMSRYSFECMLKSRRCCTLNDEPRRASRPFDRDRQRGVLSEGAGLVVLENLDHALARGCRPYAEVAGYASCADIKMMGEGNGMERAMQKALANARMDPCEITYVSAHGPSDIDMDIEETRCIKGVFGEHAYETPVMSIKGVTGCPAGAGGVLQAIAACLSIREGKIPPTANYDTPDPDCDLDYVPGHYRRNRVDAVLVNTHGFGRGNSCIVLRAV